MGIFKIKWPKSEEKFEFGVGSFLVAAPFPHPQLENRSRAPARIFFYKDIWAKHRKTQQNGRCRLTRAREKASLQNYAPGRGGGQNLSPPPAISAPVKTRTTNFLWKVGWLMNSIACNFGDPRSISSGSNKFIFFLKFSKKSTYLHFFLPKAKTIRDRNNLQKAPNSFWNSLLIECSQIWPKVNGLGCRGHRMSLTVTQIYKKRFFATNVFLC